MIPTRRLVTIHRGRSPSAMERLAGAVLRQALDERDVRFFDHGPMLAFWIAVAGLREADVVRLARQTLAGQSSDNRR